MKKIYFNFLRLNIFLSFTVFQQHIFAQSNFPGAPFESENGLSPRKMESTGGKDDKFERDHSLNQNQEVNGQYIYMHNQRNDNYTPNRENFTPTQNNYAPRHNNSMPQLQL